MTNKFFITGAVALALSITAVGVSARGMDDQRGARITFEELDMNADGKVTDEEFQAHRAARFAKSDTDGNGLLSAEEMQAAAQAQMAERMAQRTSKMMERMDANGDGQIALEEMGPKEGGAKMMTRLDADKDGAISAEEFAQMRDGRGKGREGHEGRKGHHKGGDFDRDGGRGMKKPQN